MPLDSEKMGLPVSRIDAAQLNLDMRALAKVLYDQIVAEPDPSPAAEKARAELLELREKMSQHFVELTGWREDDRS